MLFCKLLIYVLFYCFGEINMNNNNKLFCQQIDKKKPSTGKMNCANDLQL